MKVSHQKIVDQIMTKLTKYNATDRSKPAYMKLINKIIASNNNVAGKLNELNQTITHDSKTASKAKAIIKTAKIAKLNTKYADKLSDMTAFPNNQNSVIKVAEVLKQYQAVFKQLPIQWN